MSQSAPFDLRKYIGESKQVINRASTMRDKVKALLALDAHDEKWDVYLKDIWVAEIDHPELEGIHTELWYTRHTISSSLTKQESERYGTMIPDSILDPDIWNAQRTRLEESTKAYVVAYKERMRELEEVAKSVVDMARERTSSY